MCNLWAFSTSNVLSTEYHTNTNKCVGLFILGEGEISGYTNPMIPGAPLDPKPSLHGHRFQRPWPPQGIYNVDCRSGGSESLPSIFPRHRLCAWFQIVMCIHRGILYMKDTVFKYNIHEQGTTLTRGYSSELSCGNSFIIAPIQT